MGEVVVKRPLGWEVVGSIQAAHLFHLNLQFIICSIKANSDRKKVTSYAFNTQTSICSIIPHTQLGWPKICHSLAARHTLAQKRDHLNIEVLWLLLLTGSLFIFQSVSPRFQPNRRLLLRRRPTPPTERKTWSFGETSQIGKKKERKNALMPKYLLNLTWALYLELCSHLATMQYAPGPKLI